MKRFPLILAAGAVAATIAAQFDFVQSNAIAQTQEATRPALDVPFVPTPQEVVNAMLKMARVGPSDYVIDLGSGDGRIVMTAVKEYGARGFGVDLNPDHIARSNRAAREAGIANRATFFNGNLFETDISKATVLTMYLLPDVNLKLRPRLLNELKPGTRVVSHDFNMGEWKPDRQADVGAGRTHRIYAWIIPAQVQGEWMVKTKSSGEPIRLKLSQKFQQIEGSAQIGEHEMPLQDAYLEGDRIAFTLVGNVDGRDMPMRFEGRVAGNAISGKVAANGTAGEASRWRATKA